MISQNNLLRSQSSTSHARLLLCVAVVASATGTARPTPCGRAYQFDMWFRHNLKVSLHRNKPLCGVLSRRPLMKQLIELLAIWLGEQTTLAKSLVIAIQLSQQAGKPLVMRGSLLTIPHRLQPIADCVTLLHLGLLATVLWGNQ